MKAIAAARAQQMNSSLSKGGGTVSSLNNNPGSQLSNNQSINPAAKTSPRLQGKYDYVVSKDVCNLNRLILFSVTLATWTQFRN